MAPTRRSSAPSGASRSLAISLALVCAAGLSFAVSPAAGAEDPVPAQPLPKADLSSPLGKQVQEKLDTIDREVARLKDAGGKAGVYGGQLAEQVRRARERLDGKAVLTPAEAATPELHLVGLYEGDFPDGPKKYGRAVVQVDVAERPVVLALCAYSPVRWDVRVGPGVELRKIVVSGYGEQILDPAPPAGVAVETRTVKGRNANAFYTYKAETPEFARAAEILRDWTHLEIATFQGEYRFKGEPIVVGPTDNEWRLRRAMNEVEPVYREATARDRAVARRAVPAVRFPALLWGPGPRFPMLTAELADFTAVGPIEKSVRPLPARVNRITVDPRGPTYYAVGGQDLVRIDPAQNKATKLEIKGDLPDLSWPCGVAFDTKRNRLILTSLGGVGYMYAYEPDKDQWSLLRDMANVDLENLTYSAAEDCFYGLVMNRGERGRPALQRFDASGAPDRRIELGAPLSVGEPGMGVTAPTQIIATGGTTLVALAPPPDRRGGAGTMTASVVDLRTGQVIQSQPIRPAVEPRALAPDELDRRWLAVAAAATAADAEAAIRDLSVAGDAAVALVRARLPAAAGARPDAAKVREWIAQLDAPDWKTRETASQELGAVAGQVRPELEAALAGNPGDEGRTRLQGLLTRLGAQLAAPATAEEPVEAVRDPVLRVRLRAVRVLERIATPDAVDLLRDVAAEASDTLAGGAGRGALRRM